MKSSKLTEPRRWYDDACGAAHGLELVGERWALLVMRELMFGPRRFSELRGGLPGISANVLTQRLAGLEAAGIARRRHLPPPASVQVYELTEWGLESEPIFQVLGRWAARSPAHDPTLPLSAASLMLSFRTMLDGAKAGGLDARIGFRMKGDGFVGHLAQGRFDIVRRDPEDADLLFAGAPPAIAAAVYGGQPIAALEEAGTLKVEGPRWLAGLFLSLFPLPEKAGILHLHGDEGVAAMQPSH